MLRLFFLGALCIAPMCQGGLIGTTVAGFLGYGGFANQYDPANGLVPQMGYQNSVLRLNSPTVVIVGGNEFGFDDSFSNLDVTSFSGTGFTFTDTSIGLSPAIALAFTDAAFRSVSLISSTFPGLTYAISGHVITVNIPAFVLTGAPIGSQTLSASFNVGLTADPEPSSFALMALGAAALAGLRKFRTRTKV